MKPTTIRILDQRSFVFISPYSGKVRRPNPWAIQLKLPGGIIAYHSATLQWQLYWPRFGWQHAKATLPACPYCKRQSVSNFSRFLLGPKEYFCLVCKRSFK